jgi:phosphoserine phosphatase
VSHRQTPAALDDALSRAIEALLRIDRPLDERIAVFDADGTLWGADSADSLLGHVDGLDVITPPWGSQSLLGHSDILCARDRHLGYSWAATVYAGRTIAEVDAWAEASWLANVRPTVFNGMADLVAQLLAADWDVWVVSASPRFAVLPGLTALGVRPDRILAIEVETRDGRYTAVPRVPITQGQGKVVRIRRDVPGVPLFAAGNSVDDIPMMELAERALAVNPKPIHGAQTGLATIARERGWAVSLPQERDSK